MQFLLMFRQELTGQADVVPAIKIMTGLSENWAILLISIWSVLEVWEVFIFG